MKIQINNGLLATLILSALLLTFAGGWLVGRLSRDNASERLIMSQNDIIRTMTYSLGDTRAEVAKRGHLISDQRQVIREQTKQNDRLEASRQTLRNQMNRDALYIKQLQSKVKDLMLLQQKKEESRKTPLLKLNIQLATGITYQDSLCQHLVQEREMVFSSGNHSPSPRLQAANP